MAKEMLSNAIKLLFLMPRRGLGMSWTVAAFEETKLQKEATDHLGATWSTPG